MRLLSSTKVSTILAGCGVVLEFYFVFNGYKSVYLLDIRIGVIQGVVQMKN